MARLSHSVYFFFQCRVYRVSSFMNSPSIRLRAFISRLKNAIDKTRPILDHGSVGRRGYPQPTPPRVCYVISRKKKRKMRKKNISWNSHEWTRSPDATQECNKKNATSYNSKRVVRNMVECIQRIEHVSLMLIEFPLTRIGAFPYEIVHPRTPLGGLGDWTSLSHQGIRWEGKENTVCVKEEESESEKRTKPREKGGRDLERERNRREERVERRGGEEERETERIVMQSGKPCRSPFVRSHASYWFAYTSFSLLHGGVFDQSNGIFSTTRLVVGRDSGDIGHFLVAIRQWKPPTVKTIGKEKKREKYDRGQQVMSFA